MRPSWEVTIVLFCLCLVSARPVLAADAPATATETAEVTGTPAAIPSATAVSTSTAVSSPAVAATIPAALLAITQPGGGAALQGQIAVLGSDALHDFASAEVAFAYSQVTTPPWYPISNSTTPVTNGLLANWDTTTITDGTYDLRLAVTLKDGSQKVVVVRGLRVRNYTPIETATLTITPTAAPVLVTLTLTPTLAPTAVRPEPTPLPTNPAAVSPIEIDITILKGVGAALLLFASVGLYLTLRARMFKP